ncbi:MAG: DUF2306 domain-containing protein [Bacteroidota bacterium]
MKKYLLLALKVFIVSAILYYTWKMVELTLPYLSFEKNIDFLKSKLNVYHIDYWRWGFYIHIFTSPVALIAGATQFSATIMRKYPKVHRWMGMAYVLVVLLVSAPGAMAMAFHANFGLPAVVSFVMLTSLWFTFTLMAYICVRKKNYFTHGEFMLRSYALTFSAVTFRLIVYFFTSMKFQVKPAEVYFIAAWMSWVPNLIIAEIMIRMGWIQNIMKRRLQNQ